MAKPFADRTGNGGHIHFHLADAKTGANVFEGDDDSAGLGLSKTALYFIGGVLEHAKALCAVTSPTVNCYKDFKQAQLYLDPVPDLLGHRHSLVMVIITAPK